MWVEKRFRWCLLIPGVLLLAYFSGASAAPAQQPKRELGDWLVRLQRASPVFGRRVEKTGGTVLASAKSQRLWLVSLPVVREAELRRLSGVEDVQAAIRVVLETEPGIDLSNEMELLGGLALHRYDNVAALSVAIPLAKMQQVRALPGVRRVRKEKEFLPTALRLPASGE
jgi:hypothetical protein